MMKQTSIPGDALTQKLMLPELAFRLVPIHCQRRDEAVAVQDGEPPPAEWLPELEARRVKFVNYELANALESIAVKWLGPPSTSWDLEAWKRCTPDWKRRIAQARKEVRALCTVEKRKIREERTSSIIASLMADERTMEATEAIRFALRTAMMSSEATVQATSATGERRQLDRAEIAEASIDHLHNTLEVRGLVWCTVGIEWAQATPVPRAPELSTSTATATISPFGRRKRTGIKPGKREVLKNWIRLKFPDSIPADLKNDAVLDDFASEKKIRVSEKTLRRALDELALEAEG